jgi:hypothetical protein
MEIGKVENLLKEYDDHRIALKTMIKDLEALKEHVDKILPTNLESRYIRFFEEKIKTITALFGALLEMRKEIARSVKEEIEIRRKLERGESEYELEDVFNVRDFATKIDDFKDEQKKLRAKVEHKDLKDYEGIDIPGVTERIEE